MNVKRKGNAGEREFLSFLEDNDVRANRNEQRYVGGKDNPDISAFIGGIPFHVEVKRTERFRLYDALDQAKRDANGHRVPLIAHRQNRRPWVIVMDAGDFLKLFSRSTNPRQIPVSKATDDAFARRTTRTVL